MSRTASADFPPVVAPDSERELLFAIGPRAVFARATTIEADVPVEVDTLELRVGVHAPDFTTRTASGEEQSWGDLTLDLTNPEERQDLRFRLRARSTKRAIDSTITVTVYKASLPLGSVELATRIDPKYRAPTGSFALSFAAAPEPDFTLIIADRSRDVVGKGPFDLRIGREQEYVDKALGEFRVSGNAWAEARKILERFRSIKKLQTKAERIEAAQTIGVNLWWRLPEAFQKTYWDEMHGRDDLSIAIYSQEPYIPWELVVPQRKRGSVRVEKMLGVAFSMARWTSGREFPDPLRVSGFSVIAPEYDVDELPMAQQEADDLVAFGARKVPGRRSEVRRLLRSKGVQLIHFAGHGSYNPDRVDDSSIRLSDGMLVPGDLAFASIGKAEHPFVMLNACQVGEKGWDLTQIGGWAEEFCAVGFSGFVGPYWKVSDGVARKAAGIFYGELRDGHTVGQAMQKLRAQFREDEEFPAHPSWLAYTLHCQPNVHVEMPADGGG